MVSAILKRVLVGAAMVAAGTITYGVTYVALVSGGVERFDHIEGLLDPSVGGWLAWGGLGILFLLPSLAFLAPLAYASRHHVKHAAATAVGIGMGLIAVGITARSLVSSAADPHMLPFHDTVWRGVATDTPVTLTLDAGTHYYVLMDGMVVDQQRDISLPDVTARGPGNGKVAVHRMEDGYEAFPSPDDPTEPPWDQPAGGSVVIGDFVTVESGPYEIRVAGSDRTWVTAGHPEWGLSWESHPFFRNTTPLYGMTILTLGGLGFVAKRRRT